MEPNLNYLLYFYVSTELGAIKVRNFIGKQKNKIYGLIC